MVSYALVGRCGLYCGSCMIYRAYKESGKFRKLIAERAKCRPEDIRCEGCQTVLTEGWNVEGQQWGKNCKIVRCLEAKGLKFCYECGTFPDCDKFREIYDSELRHGENLIENSKRIKAGEVKEWLEEEEKKWVCKKCGKPISDYEEYHWCGAKLHR
ncbi:DUF3795 domain-containing protein [Candidatus Bathyarchaeota archaeon]|nr:MAG: DUF3795 domain-containing protein [Candidatus Bathyarchaeota archaeon]